MKFEFSYNDLETYFGKLNAQSNNKNREELNNIKQILFIDTQSVLDHNELRNCVNAETIVISYNSVSTKRRELSNVLKQLKKTPDLTQCKISIERFGFAFSTDTHLDNTRFIENTTYNDPANVQWLVNMVKRMNIKTIDFFGCNTLLHQEWRTYYNCLITRTSATIYANSRFTGNPNMGGSWQFDQIAKSTNHYDLLDDVTRVNDQIDKTYFNPEISKYPHLLDYSFPQVIMIDTNNNVWVCGRNNLGQLGLKNRTTPINYLTSVTSPLPTSTIKSVGGCSNTLFIIYDTGELYASGANGTASGGYGLLLNSAYATGTNTGLNGFVQCSNLTSGKKASAVIANSGSNSSCLYLMTDGTIYSLGSNSNGDFGIGEQTTAATLTAGTMQSSNYLPAKPIDMQHTGVTTIILMNDGTVWGCGSNNYLGQNVINGNTRIPTKIAPPTGQTWTVKQISASTTHVLLLTTDNKIYGTGQNGSGQLGNGSNTPHEYSWVEMTLSSIIKTPAAISTGTNYSVVLFQDGTAYACGSNLSGQFGTGTTTPQSTTLLTSCLFFPSPDTSKKISAIQCVSSSTTIVLASDGTVYSCGHNINGILAATGPAITQRTSLGKMYKSDATTPMTNVKTLNINYTPIDPISVPFAPTITNITASSDGTSQTITVTQPAPTESSSAPTTYYYSTNNEPYIDTNTSLSTFTINTSPGTSVKIKAYNRAGFSTESNAITVGSAPVITSINPVLLSSTSLTVNYSASTNGSPSVTKYQYSTNGGSFADVPSNPFTITGLTAGVSCSVIMRALSGTTWTSSNSTSATGAPYIIGSQPTISVTNGTGKITVAYAQTTQGTESTTYYYSLNNGSSTSAPVSPFELTGTALTSASPYSIYVLARNPAGDISSNIATGNVFGSIPTVTVTPELYKLTIGFVQTIQGTSPTTYYYSYNADGSSRTGPVTSPFYISTSVPNTVYMVASNPAGDLVSSGITGTPYYTDSVPTDLVATPITNTVNSIRIQFNTPTAIIGDPPRTEYQYSIHDTSVDPFEGFKFAKVSNLQTTDSVNTFEIYSLSAGTNYRIYLRSARRGLTSNLNWNGTFTSVLVKTNSLGSQPTFSYTSTQSNQSLVTYSQSTIGTSPVNYYYYLNGSPTFISTASNGTVVVPNLTNTTANYYSLYILASNPGGDISSNSQYINFLGTAPQIGSVTPGTNKLTIAFSQSNSGTSPTTYYYSSDSFTKSRLVTSPFDISGITTQQTIYIIASNPVGDVVSASTQGTPYIIGTSPTITTITPATNSLLVHFSGSTGGYPLTTTYLYSLDGGQYIDANTTVSPFTITISNATVGTEYFVKIIARNAAGDTPASNELGGTPIVETRPQISPSLYWSSQYWAIVSYWRNASYWSKRR